MQGRREQGINSGIRESGRCDKKGETSTTPIYLQGTAVASAMHFKAYTYQEWK